MARQPDADAPSRLDGAGASLVDGRLNQTIHSSVEGGDGRIQIDDADDTDTTANLSALFELSERTRFGIVYNAETDLNLCGDVDVQPDDLDANIRLDFKFPQWVKAGIYHDLSEEFAILASVRWEDWNSFDEIPVSVDRGDAAIPAEWRDTYGASFGLHYRPTGCCCKLESATTPARYPTPTAAPCCRLTSNIGLHSALNTMGPRRRRSVARWSMLAWETPISTRSCSAAATRKTAPSSSAPTSATGSEEGWRA